MRYLLLAALWLLPSCSDFATPAELETTQILAIQSSPASVTLGSSATLSLFAADANGPIADPQVTWSVQTQPGVPALGTVVGDGNSITYTAPSELPELPALATVEARMQDGEDTLVAVKAMLIGGPTLVNPEILSIEVDGEAAGDTVVLQRDQSAELDINLNTDASDDATYAWYARPGTIDEYRSAPTTLEAPAEAGEGWLIVVVRDGGGIAYHSVPLRVE